jgi:spore coat polysaccharide biosynthesis protein SpsF
MSRTVRFDLHMQPRIIAIVQARMSSSRLPGKVLLDIAGQPMLVRVVERARRAKTLDDVVVATTTDPSDGPITALCVGRGIPCSRGSLHDVLDRYYQAACAFEADIIVRLTADCPVIDPEVIDATVNAFSGQSPINNQGSAVSYDFAANRLPPPWHRTYPIGLDVEVCSFTALERAWKEANQPFHREHVMPYLYEGTPPETMLPTLDTLPEAHGTWYVVHGVSPRGFRIALLHHTPDYGSLRWTVDTPADLELIRQVYAHFPGCDDFSWRDVLALFQREPQLAEINADVEHKTVFDVDSRVSRSQE